MSDSCSFALVEVELETALLLIRDDRRDGEVEMVSSLACIHKRLV